MPNVPENLVMDYSMKLLLFKINLKKTVVATPSPIVLCIN
jgi:hypothetical protein